jgi:hypothetical protein
MKWNLKSSAALTSLLVFGAMSTSAWACHNGNDPNTQKGKHHHKKNAGTAYHTSTPAPTPVTGYEGDLRVAD